MIFNGFIKKTIFFIVSRKYVECDTWWLRVVVLTAKEGGAGCGQERIEFDLACEMGMKSKITARRGREYAFAIAIFFILVPCEFGVLILKLQPAGQNPDRNVTFNLAFEISIVVKGILVFSPPFKINYIFRLNRFSIYI